MEGVVSEERLMDISVRTYELSLENLSKRHLATESVVSEE
jgi:hypothetical protein